MKELEIISRTESVVRWQGVKILGKRKNISEHCYETAIYSLIMFNQLGLERYGIDKGDLLQCSLIHDIPEAYTGDMPVSAKQRKPEIKAILDELEKEVQQDDLPILFNKEFNLPTKFITKVADYLCVRNELLEEIGLGNKTREIKAATQVVNRIYETVFEGERYKSISPELKREIRLFIGGKQTVHFLSTVAF